VAGSTRLKDHWAEQRLFGRRVLAASIVILLLIAALGARLFYLQVVRHDYFSDLSQGNRIRIEPIPPSRGLILDRHGEPLALNRPAYQLELVREQTPDVEDTLARLVGIGLLTSSGRCAPSRRDAASTPCRSACS
jgi:penicillin-binding protein 2